MAEKKQREPYRLDGRGWICPYPKYLVQELLERLPSGQIIEIAVDCPSAADEVPELVTAKGAEMIKVDRLKPGEWLLVLKT